MDDSLKESINKHLRNLSMGLVQNSNEQIFSSHRELYRYGKNVLPIVEQQLLNQSWVEIKQRPQSNRMDTPIDLWHLFTR